MENRLKTWNEEKQEMIDSLNELLNHENNTEYSREELIEDWQSDGSIEEIIDRSIDIYYYTLRLWSVENYQYIQDAIAEFGCDINDWHLAIQRGQYLYYSEVMQDAIDQWIEETN